MENNAPKMYTKVFGFQVILGLISNTVLAIVAYFYGDSTLINIAITLLALTPISYLIAIYGEVKWGIHFMLLAYLFSSLYASTTHLAVLPLLLIYPVGIGLAFLITKNRNIRLVYSIFCLIAIIITIYYNQKYIDVEPVYLISSISISVCLLLAFSVLSFINSNLLLKFQDSLKEKNAAVEAKNAELTTYINSNLQLENFAHLASHELKTPLGNLSNLTSLLSDRMADKFNDQEKEISEIIQLEVARMDQLIGDLLALSNVKNEDIQFNEIDGLPFINDLIKDNFSSQSNLIKIASFPKRFKANKEQMNQLFINLIENGLKFTHFKETEKQITISMVDKPKFILFKIADNGIGVKEEFRENIFLIFKRLHNKNEFKGTGIGLSICKGIVDRHGGNIWVEENPGGGSVFIFTLNKRV
jgi:signal transduction histidine kinase